MLQMMVPVKDLSTKALGRAAIISGPSSLSLPRAILTGSVTIWTHNMKNQVETMIIFLMMHHLANGNLIGNGKQKSALNVGAWRCKLSRAGLMAVEL